ncbi:TPA: anaerobic sulfatase maturase [Providencia rettgeri]
MKIAFHDNPPIFSPPTRAAVPFHILLKPVGAGCNLKCDYCYYPEDQLARSKPMIKEMLEPFIRHYIASQPAYSKEINFVWQGGEPLLAGLDFYKKAIALQQKYAPSQVKISNSLQTNATLLTPAWCRFLKQHDFIVGVSLDGPKEIHDRYRLDKKGQQGSYDAVLKGIRLLQEFGIEFNILTVVHDAVANQAVTIYDHFTQLGVKFIQFQPLMAEGSALEHHFTLSAHNWGQFLTDIYSHWQSQNHIGQVFVMNIEQVYSQYFTHVSQTCVHSERCGTNLIMETQGEIFACDHQMNASHYLGHFSELTPFSEQVSSSISLPFGQNKSTRRECQSCTVKSVCQGGCPAHINSTGKNALCDGYFRFFDAVMAPLRKYERSMRGVQQWRQTIMS